MKRRIEDQTSKRYAGKFAHGAKAARMASPVKRLQRDA
jgi:hypothetical protein